MFLVKALWVFGLWQGLPPLLVEAVDHDPLRSRIQDLRSDAERLETHTLRHRRNYIYPTHIENKVTLTGPVEPRHSSNA